MTSAPKQTFIPETLSGLVGAIEALLFVHVEPVSVEQLIDWTGRDEEQVSAAIDMLEQQLDAKERGLHLLRVAGGIQLATKPEFHRVLQRATGPRPPAPLSRAALETLAVIAYKQPVTRAQIDRLRGVRSQGALYTLQDRELVEEAARAELPGRPILYRTTEKFLHWCGIPSLAELPPLPAPEPTDEVTALTEAAAVMEPGAAHLLDDESAAAIDDGDA